MQIIRSLSLILFIITSSISFGQLPKKTLKLDGKWEYKNGGGFEVWNVEKEEMTGYAYRVNKVGDTSRVESITIRKVNKNLMYLLQTNSIFKDTVVKLNYQFLGGKRKMDFYNIHTNSPYSIAYKFGFLNRNRLKIKIQYGLADKPLTLILNRIKE